MSSEKEKLYKSIYEGYLKAFANKPKQKSQEETNKIWSEIKTKSKTLSELNVEVEKKLKELKQIELRNKVGILSYWTKLPNQVPNTPKKRAVESKITFDGVTDATPSITTSEECEKENSNFSKVVTKQAPKQDQLKNEIFILQKDIAYLTEKRNCNLLSQEDYQILGQKQKLLVEKNRDLVLRQKATERQTATRLKRKKAIEALDPDIRKKLCGIKNSVSKGRPLACDQDSLIKAIVDIAMKGSASDDRRRTEMVRTVKTLNDLVEELKNHGYNLSRSGVYLRLLPSRSLSTEGKRHVKTAPVRLIRAQNSEHKYHADTKFAKSSISALEELAAVLGPKEVTFHSQDDKARVPIGLTAASKQAPMMMHIEYKVTLADHDFVIASQHKLIPSVIAAIEIKKDCMEKQAVTYSGPTYIAIRSAKHDSSTALSHLEDMNRINHLPAFKSSLFTEDGVSKPIMIITVDGGPDENPRYEKTIHCAKTYFKEHDLDAMFVATNAPGRSAFNRVERRMAPLSHDLAGIILPFDHFGSHLNSRGETTDKVMEKANFAKAGEVLAQIWSSTVIDGFETKAEYIKPNSEKCVQLKHFGAEWDAKHVRESQYFLQIVKCNDQKCCGHRRSSLFDLIPTGFLPPPISLFQGEDGLECNNTKNNFASLFLNLSLCKTILPTTVTKKYPNGLPYDYSCPSIQNSLPKRVCTNCSLYFATIKSMKQHKTVCSSIGYSNEIQKVRPQRLVAQRLSELMCVFLNSDKETIEWYDQDDVDTSDLNWPSKVIEEYVTPILEGQSPIWEQI